MKLAVVSPHLDDGVFSLGATLSALSRSGVDVQLVTVFAGDPQDQGAASFHDEMRGISTISAATAARRAEDQAASEVLGITPAWCDNLDSAYLTARDPELVWKSMSDHLGDADLILIPGYPLTHYDHSYSTLLVLREVHRIPLALYGEIPYLVTPKMQARGYWSGRRAQVLTGHQRSFGPWLQLCPQERDWERKRAAVDCYAGELAALGKLGAAGLAYDRIVRREAVAPQIGESLPEVVTALKAAPRLRLPAALRGRAPR